MIGTIDGGSEYMGDTLIFSIATPGENAPGDFLASLGSSGISEVNGSTGLRAGTIDLAF